MRFEWDETKNRTNIRKYGFDFTDAWKIFEFPVLTDLDDRYDYREGRWTAIGVLGSRIVVIVYTEPAQDTVRIISLRKALQYEQEIYKQTISH